MIHSTEDCSVMNLVICSEWPVFPHTIEASPYSCHIWGTPISPRSKAWIQGGDPVPSWVATPSNTLILLSRRSAPQTQFKLTRSKLVLRHSSQKLCWPEKFCLCYAAWSFRCYCNCLINVQSRGTKSQIAVAGINQKLHFLIFRQ